MSLNDRLRRLERAAGPTDKPCPNCRIQMTTIGPGEPLPSVPPCLRRGGCLYPDAIRSVVIRRPADRERVYVVE